MVIARGDNSGLHGRYRTISQSPDDDATVKEQDPPKIPPRMKKQGPELPEKPAHLRLTNLTNKVTLQSSQKHHFFKETPVPETFCNLPSPEESQNSSGKVVRKKVLHTDREILVAATKGTRERPVEKRQREPAKLLTPLTSTESSPDNKVIPQTLPQLTSPSYQRKNNRSNSKISATSKAHTSKNKPPVILIPRSQLDTRNIQQFWKSYPVSYAVWVQNSGSGDAQVTSRLVKKVFSPGGGSTVELHPNIVNSRWVNKPYKDQQETKIIVNGKNPKAPVTSTASAKQRSSSVTRSGSLTSHDSTSSDSGNETFPKSVLKKHRRESNTAFQQKKNIDQKKNVTFNAFATVQLMDE